MKAPKTSTESEINVQAGVYSSEIGDFINSNFVKAKLYQSPLSISLYQSVPNVSFTINKVSVKVGERISYSLEVFNHHQEDTINEIRVTNIIPKGLSVTSEGISDGGFITSIDNSNIITWNNISLAPQTSKTLSFSGVINDDVNIGEIIENTASISHLDPPVNSNSVLANIVREDSVQEVYFEKTAILGINKDDSEFTSNVLNLNKNNRTITYKLSLNNTTDNDLFDVIVMDRIPISKENNFIISSSNVKDISESGIIKDDTIVWSLETVQAGQSVDLFYTVEIPETETKETWNNQATVTFFSTSYQMRNTNPVIAIYTPDSSTVTPEPEPEPEPEPGPSPVSVLVNKTQSVNGSRPTTNNIEVNSGDKIQYNIQITNNGNQILNNLSVSDKIPEGKETLILDKESITSDGSFNNNTINWTIPTLNIGESVNLEFSAIVPVVLENSSWSNRATLTGLPEGPINSNTVTANLVQQVDLNAELSQALEGNPPQKNNLIVKNGDNVEYTLKINNPTKVDINNIVINDSVPEDLSIIKDSISNNGVVSNNVVTWKIDKLEALKTQVITFKVKIPESAKLQKAQKNIWTNQAELFYNNQTIGLKSNKVTCELMGLNIVKSQSVNSGNSTTNPVIVHEGDSLTYTLEISNSISTPLENITVSDTLPEGISFKNNKAISGNTQTWNIDKINSGDSVTLTVETVVTNSKPNTILENTASAKIGNLNEEVNSNTVVAEVSNQESGVFLLKEQSSNSNDKTSNPISVNGLEPISYHLTVINNTDKPVYEIEVNDTAPEGCQVLTESLTGDGKLEGNNLSWFISYLEPQKSITFDFSCLINKSDSSPIINTANLSYLGDQVTEIQSNEVTANILGEITVIKKQGLIENNLTTQPLKINNNSNVYYEISVTNNTNETLTNLSLSDPLPAGLTVNPDYITDNGTLDNNIITWNKITINPGETVSFNFNANARFNELNNELVNTAILSGDSIGNQNSNDVVLQNSEILEQTPENSIPQNPDTGTNKPGLEGNNSSTTSSNLNTISKITNSGTTNRIKTNNSVNPKTGIKADNFWIMILLTIILLSLLIVLIKYRSIKRD